MTDFVNRAYFAVASAPGAGNIAVGAAVTGPYRALGAAQDGMTFDVAITDGNAWEVRSGCVYTHGTTTLTRGTLEDSSTGSAISLSASAKVMVTATSARESFVERLMHGTQPGGRLTLTSGTPVTTSDVTGAATLYYTPYVHDTIVLWDGARWRPVTFAETSLALGTMTANANYDVFGYLSGGALALEKLVWTSDTARATAVTIQDGRYCKSGDKTRLYLGTFRSTSTTTTEDSAGGVTSQVGGKRFVWNMYNRVKRGARVIDTTDSWTYAVDTVRQANAANGNKLEIVQGMPSDSYSAQLRSTAYLSGNSSRAAKVGIGVDSVSVFSGTSQGGFCYSPSALGSTPVGLYAPVSGEWSGALGTGYHYLAWLEKGSDGECAFLGDNGGDGQQSGMSMESWA